MIINPFYVDDAAFYGLAQRSAQLLKLLMDRGPYHRYFSELSNLLFVADPSGQE